MREIYRGKRKDNGMWVVGFYFWITIFKDYPLNSIADREAHFIIPLGIDMSKNKTLGEIQVEVDSKTVGQLIGRNDKKGKKIFEGDIFRWTHEQWSGVYIEKVEHQKIKLKLIWVEQVSKFMLKVVDDFVIDEFNAWDLRQIETDKGLEIIGNIHDNPELLESVI